MRTVDGRNAADLRLRNVRVADDSLLRIADDPARLIEEALTRFAFLIASESLGVMWAMLRLTHTYLTEREQFGQKLAGFQVLQHRLVDMLLAATRSESLLELARVQLDHADHASARETMAAAMMQTDAAAAAIGEDAIQLHGAIGMTDEYIAAHFFKRLTANRLIAGDRAEHAARADHLRK
jgi:alkylation response protein AidB-like acyl-CoA dehydrogenase